VRKDNEKVKPVLTKKKEKRKKKPNQISQPYA